jgi:hypothetical protein
MWQSYDTITAAIASRLPATATVEFESVLFTNTFCQAVAKALTERSEITKLHFNGCSFPEGGSAVIASALKTNTTLKWLHLYNGADEVYCEALAATLLFNSTLQTLEFDGSGSSGSCSWLSPLFLALQVNNGLNYLRIYGIDFIDEKLSTAMRIGLAKYSTLETLEFPDIKSGDNDTTSLWREALSFLRTNAALKTLKMRFDKNVTESRATAIRMEVAAALRENESLETLSLLSEDASLKD